MEYFRPGDVWKFVAWFWKSAQSLNIGLDGGGGGGGVEEGDLLCLQNGPHNPAVNERSL